MFIELTEFLRCPGNHPFAHCVLVPGELAGRSVASGTVGCTACRREYVIRGGIVRFGSPPGRPVPDDPPEASLLQALLGLDGPGGYVVLLGSAARAAGDLSGLIEGIHFVGVNAPGDVSPAPHLTLIETSGSIPLRTAMARGVVLPREYVEAEWTAEAARVLLPGLRLVALGRELAVPGIQRLAGDDDAWVGQKQRDKERGKREE